MSTAHLVIDGKYVTTLVLDETQPKPTPMDIRHVKTDLFSKTVDLQCQIGVEAFYVHVIFEKRRGVVIQKKNSNKVRLLEPYKQEIEQFAKDMLQKAFERYLEETSVTVFLEEGNKKFRKVCAITPHQNEQLIYQLILYWFRDKWCIATVECSPELSEDVAQLIIPADYPSLHRGITIITPFGYQTVYNINIKDGR